MRACRRKWHLVCPTLYIIIEQITANYHETSLEQYGQQQLTAEYVSLIFIKYFLEILGWYFYPVQTL